MKKGFGDISGIYADAAASALKPDAVISAEREFMETIYANAGRGVCKRSRLVDDMVAAARADVAKFIGAATADQIIFNHGATEGVNQLAAMLPLAPNSVVIVSDLDHHSARLPFMKKCITEVMPLDSDFNMDAGWLADRCGRGDVSAVVITAMSNVVGVPQDVKKLVSAAGGAFTIIDAAQFVVHDKMNVADWGADAVVFSAHKIYAGTGLGVMYLKNPDDLVPNFIGGGTVAWVDGDKWEPAQSPEKFEAGTLPLIQIAGLTEALKIKGVRFEGLREGLEKIPGLKIVSNKDSPIVSFYSDKLHALDIGAALGARNICVRAGLHCASWIHKHLGIPGTVRVSLGPWNDECDVVEIIKAVREIFA
ncbi:MAG: aminotransferase class V-fold PLP-dependent enzyme [Alphaproteobacteria bacterium]|nr:aminotransferase class V-fold PLP-dependent enzyme [Alphaproteobacteria bacterium]